MFLSSHKIYFLLPFLKLFCKINQALFFSLKKKIYINIYNSAYTLIVSCQLKITNFDCKIIFSTNKLAAMVKTWIKNFFIMANSMTKFFLFFFLNNMRSNTPL